MFHETVENHADIPKALSCQDSRAGMNKCTSLTFPVFYDEEERKMKPFRLYPAKPCIPFIIHVQLFLGGGGVYNDLVFDKKLYLAVKIQVDIISIFGSQRFSAVM